MPRPHFLLSSRLLHFIRRDKVQDARTGPARDRSRTLRATPGPLRGVAGVVHVVRDRSTPEAVTSAPSPTGTAPSSGSRGSRGRSPRTAAVWCPRVRRPEQRQRSSLVRGSPRTIGCRRSGSPTTKTLATLLQDRRRGGRRVGPGAFTSRANSTGCRAPIIVRSQERGE